jgi:aryl-alcohol dehydrogenase-like predicted oxidoreductase/NAD-dependent dihydropyrimidine dehydrogenase PreA subunit
MAQDKSPNLHPVFDRRGFLFAGGAVAAGAAMAGCAHVVTPAQPALAEATVPASAQEAVAPATHEPKPIQRYRTLGRTGWKASDLALGSTRTSEANVMRYAYDRGVNVFDVAEVYGNGESERLLGQALVNMDRSKVFIITKLVVNSDDTEASIRERLAKCLERMKTPYVDALYMHNPTTLDMVKHRAFHTAVAGLKAESKIRFLGISSHGPRGREGETMERILLSAVEDGRFDLMLLVYNFLNQKEGDVVLKACQERNIGTCAMKVSPGLLTVAPFDPEHPTQEQEAMIARQIAQGRSREAVIERMKGRIRSDEERRANDWPRLEPFVNQYGLKTQEQVNQAGLQWVLGNERMHTSVVTMYDFDMVDKTIPLSGTSLGKGGQALLDAFEAGPGSDYCRHGCRDCVFACPHALPVSTIMRYAYYFHLQHREKDAIGKYARLGAKNAAHCIGCDAPCMEACPHGVRTQANLITAHSLLALT